MVVKIRKDNKGLLVSLLIGLVIFTLVAIFFTFDLLPSLKNGSYNSLMSWRGALTARNPTEKVIIVSIDDKSFEELGQFPWPRNVYGKVIEKLKADGAKVIGLDIEFANPSPSEENDRAFARAAKKAGNVVSVSTVTEDNIPVGNSFIPYKKYNLPIKVLNDAFLATGYSSLQPDVDGVIRWSSLVAFRDREDEVKKLSYQKAEKYYSFALTLSAIYLGKTVQEMIDTVEKLDTDYIRGTNVYKKNNSILINYEGKPKTFRNVSFYQVMDGSFKKNTFKNKIVLIGATSDVLHDEFLSPFVAAGNMAGVEIHANVIDDILKNEFLVKAPPVLVLIVIAFFIALTLFLTTRYNPFLSSGLSLLLYFGFLFLSLDKFRSNYWIDISHPLLALIITYITNVAYRTIIEQRKSKRTKTLFQRFVSRQVVEELLKQGSDQISLGGKKQKLVVFFSDIRNFTTMSEKLPPEEVVEVLNFYFKEMTNIAFKYGGTVDKYIGDAIMVEFGAPLVRPNDEELAVRMAIDMQERMKELREIWKNQGKEPFYIGCGINSGEAVVGFMGTERKMEYSALGDTVNLASRLESLTKEYHASIIISESVYEKVKDIVLVKDLGEATVKGKTIKTRIYDVLGLKKQ